MYQKFFTGTLQSKYIKALLTTTPIPVFDSVAEGDYIIKGLNYIYKSSVITCTRTGYIFTGDEKFLTPSDDLYISDDLYNTGFDIGEYVFNSPYIFGEKYPQFTDTFISKYRYYDPDTHVYLGKYLRQLRDNLGIDLMPLYNCFAQKTISDIYLTTNEHDFSVEGSPPTGYVVETNPQYTVFAVPIKFNEEYTIAINSPSPVLLKSFIYGDFGLVKDADDYGNPYQDYLIETSTGNQKSIRYSNAEYHYPIYYKITNTEEDARQRLLLRYGTSSEEQVFISADDIEKELKRYQAVQDNLYLFIQVNSTIKSTLTVLEGHYRNYGNFSDRHLRYPDEYIEPSKLIDQVVSGISSMSKRVSKKTLNNQLVSNLGLLQADTKSSYAFSDRLFEYLVLNVIDPQDDIAPNIVRVQQYVDFMESKGVFDDVLRTKLFYTYLGFDCSAKPGMNMFDMKPPKYLLKDIDILGYVDKNMEKFITRGLDV